ncbi:MAG TPA: nucleotidyl transferase AbiEii/AbiGii toxin family protein [Arachnia sp.]|nr:nucleotidyl transferase AbiEii/AbiGii toxin family protein [Arachnia sp.]HMT87202.1 nucleotidyl transferase AbiEii/AbiGii toxin family protein [Arachnia sp.]
MAEQLNLDFTGFRPDVVEKVMRLLLLLDRIGTHPVLGPRMCLHGGTALNLFVLTLPRLSVDIDLNYIGSTNRQQMIDERPALERAIMDVAHDLGFTVAAGNAEHSGRSFRLRYQGSVGPDSVKIDVDYLNRSPLLPPRPKTVTLASGAEVSFPLNTDIELIAGKLKALVERVAVRDLYDVNRIIDVYAEVMAPGDERLFRRIVLYYLTKSTSFPRPFEVAARFAGREKDVAEALHPMLLTRDRPLLESMIRPAQKFINDISRPNTPEEDDYLNRLARADFAPELLFADYPDVLAAAQSDPAMAWKLQNLRKAQGHTTR